MSTSVDAFPCLATTPVVDPIAIRGIPIARSLRFGQLVVTGPPGSGKSTFVQRLGGWPEEGYIDLSRKGWWRARCLSLRPREIHLGLPFVGRNHALSLFDTAWLEDWDRLRIEFSRIHLPPAKRSLLDANWRDRFAFEFLLPPVETIVDYRTERAKRGTHPIDRHIEPEQIRAQLTVCAQIAQLFKHHGMIVHVRAQAQDAPSLIEDQPADSSHGRAEASLS